MARPIKTTIEAVMGISITNYYKDGTSNKIDFATDDRVESLEFVKDADVYAITGRFVGVTTAIIPNSRKNYKEISDPIKERIQIKNVIIDHSETEKSQIEEIPAREILEYKAILPTEEIERVEVSPNMYVNLTIKLSDRSVRTVALSEGMELMDVILLGKDGKDEICNFTIKSFVYTIDTKTLKITVSGIVTEDGETINLLRFKNCGKNVVDIEVGDSIQDILDASIEAGEPVAISLPSGAFEEAITVSGDTTICGARAGISASGITPKLKSRTVAPEETEIFGPLSIEDGATVVLDGLTFTEDSYIDINNAKSVTIKNCTFKFNIPYQEKSYLIKGLGFTKNPEPVKVTITDCYFGDTDKTETKKFYNLFEFNFPLANGSAIKNNYFEKACASNNLINIYDAVDGAGVMISDNVFEYSGNAIRVGLIGNRQDVTIDVLYNTYNDTITETPEYAGLMILQPYGKKTESMAGVKIYLNGTVAPAGSTQVFYAYRNTNDSPMDSTKWPVVYVENKKQTITVGEEVTESTTTTETTPSV